MEKSYAALYVATIEDLSLILKEFKDDFNIRIDKDKYGYSIYIKGNKEDVLRLERLISKDINQ